MLTYALNWKTLPALCTQHYCNSNFPPTKVCAGLLLVLDSETFSPFIHGHYKPLRSIEHTDWQWQSFQHGNASPPKPPDRENSRASCSIQHCELFFLAWQTNMPTHANMSHSNNSKSLKLGSPNILCSDVSPANSSTRFARLGALIANSPSLRDGEGSTEKPSIINITKSEM